MDTSAHSQNSWFCVFVLWTILFTGTFTICNSIVGMNPITPVIKRIYTDIYQSRYGIEMSDDAWTLLLSLTMSITYVGGLVGSLLVNVLLRWLTRRNSVLFIYLINTIGLVIVAVGLKGAMSHEMVICGRFVVGISIGLAMSIIPLYINEITVPHRRQYYGAAYGAMMPLCSGIGTFLAWAEIFGTYERLLGTLLSGLVITILFLICVKWIPESPYQTCLQRGPDAAVDILRKLRLGNKEELLMEIRPLSGGVEEHAKSHFEKQQREASPKEIVSFPQYRKHFLAVITTFGIVMACGFSNVLSFADKTFIEAGLPHDVVTPATMGSFFISALASVVSIIAMKRFDSRTLLIFSYAVVAFSHALMTTGTQTSAIIPGMSWAAFAAMYIFMIGYGFLASASFGIMGTICIDRTRPFCLYVGGAVFWFFAWFIGFISPYLSVWIQGYSFLIWMVMAILSIVHAVILIPRTKGKTEDEIQEFFK